MPEPFLSHMLVDENSPNVARHGRWEARNYDLLQGIARATPDKLTNLAELARSVPSIWGYAILFHSIWRDNRHPAHPQLIELWRRTLTLVATRAAWRVQEVHFDLSGWFDLADSPRTFIGAAARHLPSLLFPPGQPRDRIAGLLYRGRVVALLLPSLIVLPARELMERLDPRVTSDDGTLDQWLGMAELRGKGSGPPRYDTMWSPLVLGSMHAFLETTLKEMRAQHSQSVLERNLIDRLNSFLLDLRACEKPAAKWPMPVYQKDASALESAGNPTSPIRALLLAPDLGTGGSSQTHLPLRENIKSDLSFVYFSDAMARSATWRHSLVYGQRFASALNEASITATDRAKLLQGSEKIAILHPDHLFQPKLIRLVGDELGIYPPASPWRRYMLPVTPLALAFNTPLELLERLRIRDDTDESVTVEFSLPIGSAGRLGPYIEVRRYGRDSPYEIVTAQRMTTLAVWPDVKIPELPIELIYQDGARGVQGAGEERQIQVRSPISVPVVEQILSTLANPAAPISGSLPRGTRPVAWMAAEISPKAESYKQQLLSAAPMEALECVADGHAGLMMANMRPTPPLVQARTCRVAVDFGTTNTMVVMRMGTDEPARPVETHVWMPLDLAFPAEYRSSRAGVLSAAAEFILPSGIPSPFVSLIEVRDFIETSVPFVRTRIPFVSKQNIGGAITRLLQAEETRVRSVFAQKWEVDAERRQFVVDLLFQVLLLVVTHARSLGVAPESIEWRFTRPRSFTRQIVELFERNVQQAWQRLFEPRLGMRAPGTPPTLNTGFRWESRCMFHYLRRHQPGKFGNIVVTLDVGGGSTDIALQERNGLVWDGSVALAGQSILIDYWTRHVSELAPMLEGLKDTRLTQTIVECPVDQHRALIELLVNGTDLVHHVAAAALTEKAGSFPIMTRDRARIALLGFVYFVCRFLLEPFAAAQVSKDGSPPIASLLLGGRGCLIFQTLCFHPGPRPKLIDADLIASWFERAGFDRNRAALTLSDHIKQEVALGALEAPADRDERIVSADLTPPEVSWLDGASRPPPRSGPTVPDRACFAEFTQLIAHIFPQYPGLADAWNRHELRARLAAHAASDVHFGASDSHSDGDSSDAQIDRWRHDFFVGLRALLDSDGLLTDDDHT